MLGNVLFDYIIQKILSIEIDPLELNDEPIWDITEDGLYYNKSAWNSIRITKESDSFLSKLSLNSLPFKFSFLSWRLCHGKLPFNEAITRFGSNNITTLCMCCNNPVNISMQHAFIEGEEAIHILKYIGGPLGITHQVGPIKRIFKNWWAMTTKNAVHNLVLQFVPIIICWQIWKEWTACKFGGQRKMFLNKMEYHSIWNIQEILNSVYPRCNISGSWRSICDIVERLKPIAIIRQVKWNKPDIGHVKLNLDSSYINSNGKARMGAVIGDSNGEVIIALSSPIQVSSNIQAEAMAAK